MPGPLLRLFSLAVNEAIDKSRELDVRFEVPHAPLFGWVGHAPSIEELSAALEGRRAPAGCPTLLADRWEALRNGVFHWTLQRSIALAPALGITRGSDICLVLAATAQTLLTSDDRLRAHNRAIVQRHLAEARAATAPPGAPDPIERRPVPVIQPEAPVPQPETPVSQPRERVAPSPPTADLHADERGVRFETPGLVVMFASHVGPAYAAKRENQDSVHAMPFGEGAIFALADGVSTSLGARLAAASLTHKACELMRDALTDGDAETAVRTAAVRAQAWMDDLLSQLLSSDDLSAFAAELPPESARRILRNTETGSNPRLAPALAATLVAGVVTRAAADDWRAVAVRVGDGVVERVGPTGNVDAVFAMDPETFAIGAAVSPGPLSKEAVARSAAVRACSLGNRDLLVVSSDGLARGHDRSVWSELQRITGGDTSAGTGVRQMLEQAAAFADETYRNDAQTDLFSDNLSLLVIAPKSRDSR